MRSVAGRHRDGPGRGGCRGGGCTGGTPPEAAGGVAGGGGGARGVWHSGRVFVSPENRRFLPGTPPVLLLGGAALHDLLPVPDVTGGRMPVCEGWSVAAMATLCVVDGPGDAGCVTPAALSPAELDAVGDWAQAVRDAGGALVVSLEGRSGKPSGRSRNATGRDCSVAGGLAGGSCVPSASGRGSAWRCRGVRWVSGRAVWAWEGGRRSDLLLRGRPRLRRGRRAAVPRGTGQPLSGTRNSGPARHGWPLRGVRAARPDGVRRGRHAQRRPAGLPRVPRVVRARPGQGGDHRGGAGRRPAAGAGRRGLHLARPRGPHGGAADRSRAGRGPRTAGPDPVRGQARRPGGPSRTGGAARRRRGTVPGRPRRGRLGRDPGASAARRAGPRGGVRAAAVGPPRRGGAVLGRRVRGPRHPPRGSPDPTCICGCRRTGGTWCSTVGSSRGGSWYGRAPRTGRSWWWDPSARESRTGCSEAVAGVSGRQAAARRASRHQHTTAAVRGRFPAGAARPPLYADAFRPVPHGRRCTWAPSGRCHTTTAPRAAPPPNAHTTTQTDVPAPRPHPHPTRVTRWAGGVPFRVLPVPGRSPYGGHPPASRAPRPG